MDRTTWSGAIALTGGLWMAVAAFLPWVELHSSVDSSNSVIYRGFEAGDGGRVFAVGVVLVVIGLLAVLFEAVPTVVAGVGATLGALVGGWLAWTNFNDIPRFQTEVAARTGGDAYAVIEYGLVVLAAAAGLAFIGGVLLAGFGASAAVTPPSPSA